jgi:site-specific DNA-methyltransferase (adenine-specific)
MIQINRIYNMDCLEGMDKMISQKIKVDAIITDIPYGTTNCNWDSIIPFDEMWKRLKLLRNDNTPIVLFGNEPFSSALRISNIKEYKYDWIWNKNWASGHLNAKKQPMRNHENISVFYKKQCLYNYIKQPRVMKEQTKKRHNYGYKVNNGKCEVSCNTYNDYKEMSRVKELDLEMAFPTTVQQFDVIHRSKMIHPTQKPIELIEYLIKTYTNENDLILDFTIGSGTMAIACINTSRNYIGFEIDEKYYKIANERINNLKIKSL